MKAFSVLLLFIATGTYTWGQISVNQWTWINGDSTSFNNVLVGDFGLRNIQSSTNHPSARQGGVRWTDSEGNFWLMGGNGFDALGNSGLLNDLWKYNTATRVWTWVGGSNQINALSIYGTKGVSSLSNFPGAREASISWTDENGNLWLMGGRGYATGIQPDLLNDLWKYEINKGAWTWISGSNTTNAGSVYGTLLTPSPTNVPGARWYSVSWTDNTGSLWLLGGITNCCRLNDLWKFDSKTNSWTWMHGSNNVNPIGTYGTKGVFNSSNTPGGRYAALGWTDLSGDLWLMGGLGSATTSSQGSLNDLWKFNVISNQWVWVNGSNSINPTPNYGIQGVQNASNVPSGCFVSMGWRDQSGSLWLYGGGNGFGNLGDLWKYNIATNAWTWVKGTAGLNQAGRYPLKGNSTPGAMPGARYSAYLWPDTQGGAFLMGGLAIDSVNNIGVLNDCWQFQPLSAQWQFLSGSPFSYYSYGNYGSKGISSGFNYMGAREGARVVTSNNSSLIFGGKGLSRKGQIGFLNDLWKFDLSTSTWLWLSGSDTINQIGVFGVKGVPSSVNIPPSRSLSCEWEGNDGTIWIFGGNSANGLLNDLWQYQPSSNYWTWIGGSSGLNSLGVYGEKGVESNINIPGARMGAAYWKDKEGNFWLMGGYGRSNTGQYGNMNDLWKYNYLSRQWSWMGGSSALNQSGFYGPKNSSSGGYPGARYGSVSVADSSGNLWMLGGYGYDELGTLGYLNDLWKLNPKDNVWVWVSGSNTVNKIGSYSTIGIPDVNNTPGSRQYAAGWIDRSGTIWVSSGSGYAKNPNRSGNLSDLWTFNINTNEWTFENGSEDESPIGYSGVKGVPSPINLPPARSSSFQWVDADGNLWMMGGIGSYKRSNTSVYYNDLWKYTVPCKVKADFWISKSTQCLVENQFVPQNKSFTNSNNPTYTWSIGANIESSAVEPVFKFDVPGQYNVKLVVNAGGCIDSVSRTVEVLESPIADFEFLGNADFCKNGSIKLNATGINASYNYVWMKDGSELNLPSSPFLNLSESGSYSLRVTNRSNQCSSQSAPVLFTEKELPPTPTGLNQQTFCNDASIEQLNVEGSGIKWYETESAQLPLAAQTKLSNGKSYFATQTNNGCESTDRFEVMVLIKSTNSPLGQSPQIVCNQGMISNLVVEGIELRWYDAQLNGNILSITDQLIDGKSYYVSQIVDGCESNERLTIKVHLLKPEIPSGSTLQQFCGIAFVKDLQVTGSNINWFDQPNGGSKLNVDLQLIDSDVYYASQTVEGCESNEKLAVSVKVVDRPNAPTGTEVQAVCKGAELSDLEVQGTDLQWYSNSSGGSQLLPSTKLEDQTSYYVSQSVNGCEGLSRLGVFVNFMQMNEKPKIIVNGPNLISSQQFGNQWFLNGDSVRGATFQVFKPLVDGTYTVSNSSGQCGLLISEPVNYKVNFGEFVRIAPNPVSDKLFIYWFVQGAQFLQVDLYNRIGQLIRKQGIFSSGSFIDVKDLYPGLHFIQLISADKKKRFVLSFVKL
ncbi:MAG: kelch repeat-containing protein [Lacibacter sp.]